MAFDHFTVRSLALELEARLRGKRIVDARSAGFAKSPNNRDLSSSLAFTATGDADHVFAGFGHRPILYLAPGPIPAHHTRAEGMERYIRGALVDSVVSDPRDRIIRMRLAREDEAGILTYGQLIFELVEPHSIATLISERTGKIFGCWRSFMPTGSKARQMRTGEVYQPLPGRRRLLPAQDSCSTFLKQVREEDPGEAIDRVLKGSLAGADATVAADILLQAGIPAQGRISELDDAALSRLWETAAARYAESARAEAFCWSGSQGTMFSALKPNASVAGFESMRQFDSVSAAIRHAHEAGRNRKCTAERQVRRALKSTRRTILAVEEDLDYAAQADEHDKKGSVLLSQIADVPSSAEVVELTDTFCDATPAETPKLRIELNPRLSPAENAARYLKSAAKLRRSLDVLPQRLKSLEEDERQLLDTLASLEEGHKELDDMPRAQVVTAPQSERKRGSRSPASERTPVARPRRYRTRSGWIVWAGRNNKENDLLTHHLAAPDDIWFHASGYAGSHVVLRREGRGDEPSRETLVDAASVAAYWSRGRTAKKVPVVYTLVKHVSKPKGSPPGLALPRRAKSLIVEPSLLPEQEDVPRGDG